MPTEERVSREARIRAIRRLAAPALVLGMAASGAGCGQPSEREYKNRRELEAVLTAVSLKNAKELEKDARRVEERHGSGELSDASHKELMKIVETARAGDWGR